MLKVCLECTTSYAHDQKQCPHCQHTEFVWSTELPDGWRGLIDTGKTTLQDIVAEQKEKEEIQATSPEELLPRPNNNDSLAKWQAYARQELALGKETRLPSIEDAKRDQLVEAFG